MLTKGSVEIGLETRFGPNWPGVRCGARTKAGGAHHNIGPAKSLEYSFMNRSTKITAMISVNFLLISVA